MLTKRFILSLLCICTISVALLPSEGSAQSVLTRRLIFYRGRLDRDYEPARVCSIMDMGAKAGYNGIMLQQKLEFLERKDVLPKAQRITATAKALGMLVVPMSMHQTHAAIHDTTNGEAFPVKGTPFKVTNGQARVIPDPQATVPSDPTQWNAGSLYKDATTKRSGAASVRMHNPGLETRITAKVTLKPFRAYELSVWIKTEDYAGHLQPAFYVASGTRVLLKRRDRCFMTNKRYSLVAKTMDWKKCTVDFNSLNHTNATVYLTAGKKGGKGTIWFDGTELREVGLYETLRRSTLPISVKSQDGSKTYTEGTDYIVGDRQLTIPSGSVIQNGQTVHVDWFQYANVETVNPPSNFCLEKPWEIATDQAMRFNEVLGPARAWQMEWDEWRVAFWDPACIAAHKNAGFYRGWVAQKGLEILKRINSAMEVYVWGGAYDPYHQAREVYFMTNTSSHESWNGLSDSTIVFNWRGDTQYQSLMFFGGKDPAFPTQKRDMRQGFCVWGNAGSAASWLSAMEKAEAKGVHNIIGMQYMSWKTDRDGRSGKFDDLRACSEVFKKAGRWGTNSLVEDIRIRNNPQNQTSTFQVRCVSNAKGSAVAYHLPHRADVEISLINLQGQHVRKASYPSLPAGDHQLSLTGFSLPAGMYIAKLTVEGAKKTTQSLKVLML